MFHLIEHPLIADELGRLREPACTSPEFRLRVRRVASLMVYPVTSDLTTHVASCTTPLEITSCNRLAREIILVPVLRAGLAFLDGFLDMIPQASVAHIGLARNETTLLPESYYMKHPPVLGDRDIIVLDPMLATGGSAIEAIRRLHEAGARSLRFVCLVAAPEGVSALSEACPQLPIYAAALDRCLNERGFILPGLGDAGDRMFGTGL
jgi:uracil phosphoribosyltransferase